MPFGTVDSIWNSRFHLEQSIPFGTVDAIWNSHCHLEQSLPFGTVVALWNSRFHLESVCSDEGLTLEMSAKHHIPQATNIPYQPFLIKPIFSVLAHAEKQFFSKLVFECPFGIVDSIWNSQFHLEQSIPFGTVDAIWNSRFHLEQLIPFGTVDAIWNNQFHLEQSLPFRTVVAISNSSRCHL